MGKKKKARKDDYWESAQAEEDYEDLNANNTSNDNDPDPEEPAELESDTDEELLDEGIQLDSDDESLSGEETDYTHGELDSVIFEVLHFLRDAKEKDRLPTTKQSLEDAIAGLCSVKRSIALPILRAFFYRINILEEVPRNEGDEVSEEELENEDTAEEETPENEHNAKLIDSLAAKYKVSFADNWEANLSSKHTRKLLYEHPPVVQQYFELILENLRSLAKNKKLPQTTKGIIKVFQKFSEVNHPIPVEDVVQALEADGYINIVEQTVASKKNLNLTSYTVDYSDKIWKVKKHSNFSAWMLIFVLLLVCSYGVASKVFFKRM